jgi:hypothetical protein
MSKYATKNLHKLRGEELTRYIVYEARNKRASAGLVAHDYCWGPRVGLPGCISCGCSESGPCISHTLVKEPV